MGFECKFFDEVAGAVKGLHTRCRVLALVFLAIVSFGLIVNSSWKATPDSALYLELGESMAHGQGYMFNGEPHTYVPPGFPALVTVSVWIFGDGFLTYRILMAFMGLLAAGAGYFFIRRLCGPDVALLVGGLFAVNHDLLYNSTFTTADVPFALFTLVALNAVLSAAKASNKLSWTIVAGLLVGLPGLIRVNGWGVPPAAAIFLWCAWKDEAKSGRLFRVTIESSKAKIPPYPPLKKGGKKSIPVPPLYKGGVGGILGKQMKADSLQGSPFPRVTERLLFRIAIFLFFAAVPALSWECYKSTFPGSFNEGSYLNAVSGRTAWMQLSIILTSAWNYVQETSFALTGVVLKTGFLEFIVPTITVAGMVVAFLKKERLLFSLTIIQFAGLVLTPAGSRYLLALIPALYLFLALGLVRLTEWLSSKLEKKGHRSLQPRFILVGCFLIMAALNVGHNAVTIVQARNPVEAGGAESEKDLPFFTAARWLRTRSADEVVLTMHPRVIHYLSGHPTVELIRSGVPEHEVWVEAHDQIQSLITTHKPAFLFSDAKDTNLYQQVMRAIEGLGLKLEEIPEAGSSGRYRLWRIVKGRS